MKKMLTAGFVSVLMSAGLVATSGTTAQAAYPPSITTTTTLKAPSVKQGQRLVIPVKVTAKSGSAQPVGAVRVRIRNPNGVIVREVTRSYPGSPINIIFPAAPKAGKYAGYARYLPKKNSVFKGSFGRSDFIVKKK